MEISVQLFDRICRVCLIQNAELKSLFSKIDGEERNLLDILAFTANIDVKIEDSLPKQVCGACESLMCKADAFKRRCHESESILNNVYLNATGLSDSSNIAEKCTIKDEKIDITHKLSEFGTFVSPITINTGFKDGFDKKNVISQEFPMCSTADISFNKFAVPILPDNYEQSVKKEAVNDFEEGNDFMDHFDIGGPFEIPEVDKVKEKIKSKCKKIAIRYECYCGTWFSNKDEYKTHLKNKKCNASYQILKLNKEKCKKSEVQCLKCDKIFTSLNSWKTHQRTHCNEVPDDDNIETYRCSFCLRQFKNKNSLSAHIQRHEETDGIKHVCEICKREFKYKAYLENHVLTAHSKTNGFTCDICVESFLNKEALETHKKSHDSEKKHRCSVCSKAFYMLCTLKEHMRTHTGEKPFLCSQCGKGFSQKTNLAQHMRRHQGLKPFKCETCEKRFVSKGELDAHTRKHSGAHPFVCDECGNGFTTSSALVKHRRIHTGERPYQCDLCPMSFAASGTLKNHRRTHTGERPFQCSYCEKAFVQRNDLISHIRCHTGERPYVCTHCSQSFRKASGLKTHIKMHCKEPAVGGVNALLTGMQCPEQ